MKYKGTRARVGWWKYYTGYRFSEWLCILFIGLTVMGFMGLLIYVNYLKWVMPVYVK